MGAAHPDVTGTSAAGAGDFSSAISRPRQLLMLVINGWPLLHLISTAIVVLFPWALLRWRLLAAIAVLYLVPPLAATGLRLLLPLRQGHIHLGSRAYFTWWALFNLQVVFCRLPMLEELLRLVPGVYSAWLRLWGAHVGRLTYWAAGLRILDRSFVNIGDNVIFGADVRVTPHVIARNSDGALELVLATVIIGDRALVGGYSLLAAGTEIAPGECTRAFLISPPFGKWKDGVRISKTDAAS